MKGGLEANLGCQVLQSWVKNQGPGYKKNQAAIARRLVRKWRRGESNPPIKHRENRGLVPKAVQKAAHFVPGWRNWFRPGRDFFPKPKEGFSPWPGWWGNRPPFAQGKISKQEGRPLEPEIIARSVWRKGSQQTIKVLLSRLQPEEAAILEKWLESGNAMSAKVRKLAKGIANRFRLENLGGPGGP